MTGKRIKKESSTSNSFGLSLVVVAILAIVGGYFLGNYFIKIAIAPGDSSETQVITEPVPEPQPVEPLPVVAEKPVEPSTDGLLVKIPDERQPVTSDTSPVTTEAAPADGLLRVQVGAFNSRPEAMGFVQQLKADGYQTYIVTGQPYRIQVGAFADQASAKKLVDKLISDGYTNVIIK